MRLHRFPRKSRDSKQAARVAHKRAAINVNASERTLVNKPWSSDGSCSHDLKSSDREKKKKEEKKEEK